MRDSGNWFGLALILAGAVIGWSVRDAQSRIEEPELTNPALESTLANYNKTTSTGIQFERLERIDNNQFLGVVNNYAFLYSLDFSNSRIGVAGYQRKGIGPVYVSPQIERYSPQPSLEKIEVSETRDREA